MKNYIGLFCASLLFLTGCGSKKSKHKTDIDFFKNTKNNNTPVKQSSRKTKQALQENLDAFALEKDNVSANTFSLNEKDLNTFAFDNSSQQNNAKEDQAALFKWNNINAEESKKDFNTLYFAFDKYDLNNSEKAKLNKDIEVAKKEQSTIQNGNKKIIIEGHACHSAGSAAYNLALSEKRARNVATEFIQQGIDKNNIKIAARGQEMPVVHGGGKAAQAPNRRAEMFVIDSAQSTKA